MPSAQEKLFPVGKGREKEGALDRPGAVIPHVGPIMTVTCASTALLCQSVPLAWMALV